MPLSRLKNLQRKHTLVPEHQSDSEKPILAARPTLNLRSRLPESIDEEQRQQDDVLCDLGSRQDIVNPLLELFIRSC